MASQVIRLGEMVTNFVTVPARLTAGNSQNTILRIGVFEINLRSGELCKHGLRIRMPGQAFKILAVLLELPGEVVTREELQRSL